MWNAFKLFEENSFRFCCCCCCCLNKSSGIILVTLFWIFLKFNVWLTVAWLEKFEMSVLEKLFFNYYYFFLILIFLVLVINLPAQIPHPHPHQALSPQNWELRIWHLVFNKGFCYFIILFLFVLCALLLPLVISKA